MLTKKDIKALNKARRVLKDLDSELMRMAYSPEREESSPEPSSLGRAAQAANVAGDAIFQVLNILNAYRVVTISDVDLHDHKKANA